LDETYSGLARCQVSLRRCPKTDKLDGKTPFYFCKLLHFNKFSFESRMPLRCWTLRKNGGFFNTNVGKDHW